MIVWSIWTIEAPGNDGIKWTDSESSQLWVSQTLDGQLPPKEARWSTTCPVPMPSDSSLIWKTQEMVKDRSNILTFGTLIFQRNCWKQWPANGWERLRKAVTPANIKTRIHTNLNPDPHRKRLRAVLSNWTSRLPSKAHPKPWKRRDWKVSRVNYEGTAILVNLLICLKKCPILEKQG